MMRSSRSSAAVAARESHASRTPCEHPELVFAWCARRVRFASLRGGRRSVRPHHCARFQNRAQ
eukprot:3961575-Lingulodinium_polyedra.AAC.1